MITTLEAHAPTSALEAELLPAPHAETEWWYYAGRLHTAVGDLGFHFSYFRRRSHRSRVGGWFPLSLIDRDVRFAHLSLVTPASGEFRYAQRRVPALHNAAAGESGPGLRLWVGPWGVDIEGREHYIHAGMDDLKLDVSLEAEKPLICHANGGQVHKGPSAASTHLSLPRMRVSGEVTLERTSLRVEGLAWMDREYGTFRLSSDFGGWQWLALQLDDGSELMLYRLISGIGVSNGIAGATWVDPGGGARDLDRSAVECRPVRGWTSRMTGIRYTTSWDVEVAEIGLSVRLTALIDACEIDARPSSGMIYWEGPLAVEGEARASGIAGYGYAEQVLPPPMPLPGLYDFGRENLRLGGWLRNEVLLRKASRGTLVSGSPPPRSS